MLLIMAIKITDDLQRLSDLLLINSSCGNRRKASHGFVNILEMKGEEGQHRKGQYQMEKLLAALQTSSNTESNKQFQMLISALG